MLVSGSMHPLIIGLFLGIVEGITEFLPISSTGHLVIVGHLLGFNGPKSQTFDVVIQVGAILAVVVLYWRRFVGLANLKVDSLAESSGFSGLRGVLLLGIACSPVFIIGGLLRKQIHSLFQPSLVAAALVSGGVVLLFIERLIPKGKIDSIDSIRAHHALIVGLFQIFALWPGMSRAASTIIGGMVAGLDRKTAAEFSFFVAVPVMFAASTLDLIKEAGGLSVDDIPLFAVGLITSFLVAIVAIKTFLKVIGTWSFAPFGLYRIVFGLITLKMLV